jgi:dihydrofolate synthase/folylpolyglutamate synthase
MADQPTEFELITVIGFEFFLRRNVDIVILEVGMGGQLDSTNVIDTPELAIYYEHRARSHAGAGADHTGYCARQSGHHQTGGDVLIYDLNAEADAVFEETCHRLGARLTVTDHSRITNIAHSLDALTFDGSPYGSLTCGLVGSYQTRNAAVAITAVELLQKKGWQISLDAIKTGLASVRWPARFEVLRRDPIFIADGGHNPQGVSAAAESLKAHFPDRKITCFLGIMADKDIPHMIEQIGPIAESFVTVTPNNPRAMQAEELAKLLQEHGLNAVSCRSVQEGVSKALEQSGSNGIVCALGSLYLLGDVRSILGVNKQIQHCENCGNQRKSHDNDERFSKSRRQTHPIPIGEVASLSASRRTQLGTMATTKQKSMCITEPFHPPDVWASGSCYCK